MHEAGVSFIPPVEEKKRLQGSEQRKTELGPCPWPAQELWLLGAADTSLTPTTQQLFLNSAHLWGWHTRPTKPLTHPTWLCQHSVLRLPTAGMLGCAPLHHQGHSLTCSCAPRNAGRRPSKASALHPSLHTVLQEEARGLKAKGDAPSPFRCNQTEPPALSTVLLAHAAQNHRCSAYGKGFARLSRRGEHQHL